MTKRSFKNTKKKNINNNQCEKNAPSNEDKKQIDNNRQEEPKNTKEVIKQSVDHNSQNDITNLEITLNTKKQKFASIEKVSELIKKSKSLKKVIQDSTAAEDEDTIITIIKNSKYFTFSEKDKEKAKEQIIDFLILECCKQGKVAILEKLQIELDLEFKNFSKEFYERNKLDIITIAAKNNQLEVIKFLILRQSLFLKEGNDADGKLIDVKEITEKVINFQIPFMQYIFESDHQQNTKLQFTKFLLEFTKSANYPHQEQTLITNYIIHQASKNLAHQALNYAMNYAKDNQINYKLGLFSENNNQPSMEWTYKQKSNNDDLTKTVLEQQKFDCAKHLQNMYVSLIQQKNKQGEDTNCFTQDEVQKMFDQAESFMNFKDKTIDILVASILDITNSNGNQEEVTTTGDNAMMGQTI